MLVIVCALVINLVSALDIIQVLDSVILEKDEYIQFNNFNEANFIS